MTDGMLTRNVGSEYTYEVWQNLDTYFVAQTRAKVKQFKTQLWNTKKGTTSIYDYLLWIKKSIDALISIGESISVAEHIDTILEGLPNEYDDFIVSVSTRIEPYIVAEIESFLLSFEDRIENNKKTVEGTASTSTTNVT